VGLDMQIWRAGDTLVPLVQSDTPIQKRLERLLGPTHHCSACRCSRLTGRG
jgi:hypothetical protein